jgi:hypothetical protein
VVVRDLYQKTECSLAVARMKSLPAHMVLILLCGVERRGANDRFYWRWSWGMYSPLRSTYNHGSLPSDKHGMLDPFDELQIARI